MEIEDLKSAWRTVDDRVSHSLALNLQTRRDFTMDRARASLKVLAWGPRGSMILDLIWIGFAALFMARRIAELKFVIPAALLIAWSVPMLMSNVQQLSILSRLDFAGPVVAIQQALARIYAMRVRDSRRILWTGPLLWTPLVIVSAQVFGIDLYRVAGGLWIAANLVFGLAFLGGAWWVSRRFASRFQQSSTVKRISDSFAGSSLVRAMTLLNEIEDFSRDEQG